MAAPFSNSCPLPDNSCSPALPSDTISYYSYLNSLAVTKYTIKSLNLTRHDVSFAPQAVSKSYVEQGPVADVQEGCSIHNFNLTSLHEGSVSTSHKLVCPHTFQCDYNPQRIPSHIFHIRCLSHTLDNGTKCREVFYPVVSMTTESCDPLNEDDNGTWRLKTEKVAVSCIAII